MKPSLGARASALAWLAPAAVAAGPAPTAVAGGPAPTASSDLRRSGFDAMTAPLQAMQRDDALNPALRWVGDGHALWNAKAGASQQACAACHGDARTGMRGVAARYPAFDAASVRHRCGIDAAGRSASAHQPVPLESPVSLALAGREP